MRGGCPWGCGHESLETIDVHAPKPLALPHELGQLQRLRHRDGGRACAALRRRAVGRAAGGQPAPRRHSLLTGPVTQKAVGAIKTVYDQVCGPKAVVAIGSCPATTNVFIDSRTLDGPLDKHIPVDVFVPGCPPRPDAIIRGVAKAAAILAERGYTAEKPQSKPSSSATLKPAQAAALPNLKRTRRCSHESGAQT